MTYNIIDNFIRQSPHVAIYFNSQTITYSELFTEVNKYANALKKSFSVNDEIIIMMNDRPEYFYLFWACVKIGVKPMLVHTMLTEEEKNKIILDYNPKYVFTDDNILDFALTAIDDTNNDPVNVQETDICFYLFSSGTTGHIKRIEHYYGSILLSCENYAKKTLFLNAYDKCFSTAKLSFAYGFGNSMTFPLYIGASTILMSEPSTPKNSLEIIENYKPTVYFSVPTLYSHQISALKNKTIDTRSLRMCISAGETLHSSIYNEWYNLTSCKILDGIGTTEALHIFISNRHEDNEAGCTGKVVPGYQVRIVDEQKNTVLDNKIGELEVRGHNIKNLDEWFSTGDLFSKINNKFYYKGRKKDTIKVGGAWVTPTYIESILLLIDNIVECAITSYETKHNLTKLHAWIVLENKNIDLLKMKHLIKKTCISKLPANCVPTKINFIDNLPKTATGKTKRYVLKEKSTNQTADNKS